MSLGSRIKEARESKDMLQSELAALIGVKSAGVVSNWEQGTNKPDADKIVKICEALSVSPSFLLDCHIEEGSMQLSSEEQKIIEKYRTLDTKGKVRVSDYLTDQADRCVSAYIRYAHLDSPIILDQAEPDKSKLIAEGMRVLADMRKEKDVSYTEVANYLWAVGMDGKISLQEIEKMFAGSVVPNVNVYLLLQSYLNQVK